MRSLYQVLLDYFRQVNWMLLLFLVLVMNVKMPVKFATAIIFLFLARKMFLNREIYRQRFIWFYFSMILIALLNLLLHISSLSVPYLFAVSVGIIFWLMCIMAALFNSWVVAKTDTNILHNTISLFFILNIAVTIGQLILIMMDAGSFNPYLYQGMHQKYFIGTGDMMTGISFDVSTTNALINSFGIVYFLHRGKMVLVLLCMAVLLLTASNITNILLLLVFLIMIIFQSNRNQKSTIGVCFFLLVIFMVKVSPQNNKYVTEAYKKIFQKKVDVRSNKKEIALTEKPDSLLSADEKRQKMALLYLDSLNRVRIEKERGEDSLKFADKSPVTTPIIPEIKPSVPKPNIHSEPFQRRRDTSEFQKELLDYAEKNVPVFDTSLRETKSRNLPGKLIAFRQTINFYKQHPLKMVTGDGMGNFSSKLAFRATGLHMAGSYPEKFAYTHDDFLNNHLNLYLNYFSKDIELHSLVNSPNAVYDQLIAEYGLLGVTAFILFYIGFFVKRLGKLTYGIPLLFLMMGAFWIDYWYEQLSIVIFFELLMLLNIKETKQINE